MTEMHVYSNVMILCITIDTPMHTVRSKQLTKANFEEPVQLTPTEEWLHCLTQHYKAIIANLNVKTLLPYLIKECLLTLNEQEQLESKLPYDQSLYLLRILQRKGSSGYRRFIKCLKEEKEHLGHEYLVDCLSLRSRESTEV